MREVEVLRQAADGLTSHQAGAGLSLPSRTLGHRLGHVCEKTERRTRAGVAVFAVEQPTGSTSARLSSAPPLAMPEPITRHAFTARSGDGAAASTAGPYGTEVGRYSPPRTPGGAAPHDSQGRDRRVVCRSRRLFPGQTMSVEEIGGAGLSDRSYRGQHGLGSRRFLRAKRSRPQAPAPLPAADPRPSLPSQRTASSSRDARLTLRVWVSYLGSRKEACDLELLAPYAI